MAYDFPASPTPGQEYTPPVGGQTYVWQPPRWLVKGIPPAGGGSGGGGIDEAPVDTKQYGRQNAAWTEVVPNPDWTTLSGKPATFPPSTHTHVITDTTGLQAALDLKAPLAGPAFTGNPTANTQNPGTNNTTLATTQFATNVVNTRVTTAPVMPEAVGNSAAVDWNSLITAGWYNMLFAPGSANQPAAGYFYCHVIRYSTGNVTQVAYPYGTGATVGDIWYRSLYVATWSTWRKLIAADLAVFTGPVGFPAGNVAANAINFGTAGTGFLGTATSVSTATSGTNRLTIDVNGAVYSVKMIGPTPTATLASLRLPHGIAPTTLVDGDVWSTSAGVFARINGVTVNLGGGVADWSTITNKPSTFPPSVHTHVIADTTGLESALSGKAPTFHNHAQEDVVNLSSDLAGKAPLAHTHTQSAITNLVTDLALKAPLESPVFTGDPKAPTPTAGDNDTSIATTAFVSAAIAAIPAATNTADTRNRVVNGAFQISQENGSTPIGTSGAYPADMWTILHSGVASPTALRGGAPGGYILAQSFSAATPAPAATAYFQNIQFIEGSKTADFLWGTANAKPAVLRFEIQAGVTGLYVANIQNADSTRSFMKGMNLTADVWTTVVVPIPPCTDGVWPDGAVKGMSIRFPTVVGTNYHGVADVWQANSNFGLPGMVNCAAVTAKGIYVRNVGLYLDPLATGVPPRWQMPDEAEELRACQRYWQKTRTEFSGNTTSGNGFYARSYYAVAMRTAPAAAGSNISNISFAATVGTVTPHNPTQSLGENRAANVTGTGRFVTDFDISARM